MASMITPIASPSFSSSSSTPRWIHEVFLSFHGEDTRKSFTDHLYGALKRKGILAFKDDEKLKRGKDISKGLLKAIEESMYAIVVISENYAFSRWCLIELAEIVRCSKDMGLTIFPVFYHVDPSDVRKQMGSFAEAFTNHEKDPRVDIEKMQTWRSALIEVGNISGWDLHDRHESIVIGEITGRIFLELNHRFSSGYKKLVGIDFRVEEMMNLLDIGLNQVCFIGINGMGGVGKTSLAEVIYDRASYQFEASCFISCIREETTNRGLVSLQKQLLSKIMEEEITIWDDREGIRAIRSRLRSRKVFVVLDDVDKEEQLEALAGSHDWFGLGSRIIVTSRDRQLLERHMNRMYKVEVLNEDEALQLFSLSAFKKLYPENSHVNLSKDFVLYAQGLPLALKVLGSFLFGRTTNAWKSAWNQLQENPKREIFDILQIGFGGLEDLQKELFLDIACFFKGEKLDDICEILESFGFYPGINIEVLIEKSLITLSSQGLLNMHDLVQRMGQEIVRRQSPKEPGRRSRLWHYNDILYVLKNNTGTDVVEGIVLNLPIQIEEPLSVEAFSRMRKLRILKIGSISITKRFSELSNTSHTLEWEEEILKSLPISELRLMEWFQYPFKYFPAKFEADKLIELNMRCSNIKQMWNGIQSLGSLKRFDLSGSQNLIETPDFTEVKNLEILDLEGCKSLSKVHPSIGVLKRLKLLDLSSCNSLETLPNKMSLESLEDLNLSGCSRLKKFPDVVGNMTSLRLLYLDGTAITELPLSFQSLSCLSTLSLRGCIGLSTLPQVIHSLSTIRFLQISGCKLEEFPNLNSMECLEELYGYKTRITHFPSLNLRPKNMKTLRLGGLKALPLPGRYLLLQCFSLRGNEGTLHIKFIPDVVSIVQILHLEVARRGLLGFTYGPKIMYGSSLGFGIPDWFNNKSSGSSVTLPMHSEWDENRKWLGYAMFFLYQSSSGNSLLTPFQVLTCEEDTDPFSSVCIQFDCEFLTNYPQLPKAYVRGTRPFGYGTSVGVWAYIPAQWFLKHFTNLDGLRYITTSISPTFDSYKWKIKECGARLVYSHNASEFYESIAPSGSSGVEFYHHISYYLEKCSDDVQPLPFIDLVNKSVDVVAPLQYQLARPLPMSSQPRGYEGCEFPDRSKVRALVEGEEGRKKKVGRPLTTKVESIKKHFQKRFKW